MIGGLSDKATDDQIETTVRQWATKLNASGLHVLGTGEYRGLLDPGHYVAQEAERDVLATRTVTRPFLNPLRQTSYSALSRRLGHAAELEMADRDETVDESIVAVSPTDSPLIPLGEMPGGRHVGDLVHKVFEGLLEGTGIFQADRIAVQAAVEERLAAEMLRTNLPQLWKSPLAASITDCLERPLECVAPDCSLNRLAPERWRARCRLCCELVGRKVARTCVESVTHLNIRICRWCAAMLPA